MASCFALLADIETLLTAFRGCVVGNILPCYKNYLLYVRINSLMSLSLFTKETTDVEMWLRFTRTRGLCN